MFKFSAIFTDGEVLVIFADDEDEALEVGTLYAQQVRQSASQFRIRMED